MKFIFILMFSLNAGAQTCPACAGPDTPPSPTKPCYILDDSGGFLTTDDGGRILCE